MPLAISRLQWHIEFEFSTISQSSVLIHSGFNVNNDNTEDFFEVNIRRGLPGIEISLGGGNRVGVELAEWRENHVNDGEWHKLTITYYNRVNILFVFVKFIKV